MEKFKESLKNYAGLILERGVNLKKNEYVLIVAEIVHRELVLELVDSAYRMGASYVNVLYTDERADRTRLDFSSVENLKIVPESRIAELKSLIEKKGVYIRITGPEDLEILKGVDPDKNSAFISSASKKLYFFSKVAMANKIKWCVAGAATQGLGEAVFSGREADDLKTGLWDEMFRICRIYEKDTAMAWDKHIKRLKGFADWLNSIKVKSLHYSGPGTDLTIGIHKDALWQGGGSETIWGEFFMPNIPTEEVFTAPDYRTVNGKVKSTRPLLFNNILIKDITMEFKDGKLVNLFGSKEIRNLEKVLEIDRGARYLGEVALVEKTSPIYESGLVFYNTLYDENAASHIALGAAYPECIVNGENLDKKAQQAIGFNSSKVHIDIMIGSPELSVDAELYSGSSEVLMHNGLFNI